MWPPSWTPVVKEHAFVQKGYSIAVRVSPFPLIIESYLGIDEPAQSASNKCHESPCFTISDPRRGRQYSYGAVFETKCFATPTWRLFKRESTF
jgi:hypothetical protein